MNVSGTTVSATGHKGGLGDGLYDEAGARPDLDLDFARTKSLKDRVSKEDLITFTRGAARTRGATYVDENGLVKRADHNLLINSHNIGGTNWFLTTFSDSGTTQSVTQNTTETTAPNGMFEASKLIIDTGTAAGRMVCISTGAYQDGGPIQVNDFIIASVYLKSATGQNQLVNLSVSGTARSTVTVTNEWQRFAVRAKRSTSAGTSAVGDYRLRIGLRNQAGSSGANQPDENGNFTNVHAEFYAWGAQFEHDGTTGNNSGSAGYTGTIGELIRTTTQASGAPRFTHDPVTLESKGLLIEPAATNIIGVNRLINLNTSTSSSQFVVSGNNSTEQSNGTGADGVLSPMGTTKNVAKIFLNGTEHSNSSIALGTSNTTFANTNIHTSSVFVKPSAITEWRLVAHSGYAHHQPPGTGTNDGTTGTFMLADFDLTGSGSVTGSNSGLLGTSIKKYSNNWYRLSVTYYRRSNAFTNGSHAVLLYPLNPAQGQSWLTLDNLISLNSNYTLAGIQASPVTLGYIFGPQAEEGNAATSYIPTSGSEVTRSPDLASIEGDNFGTYRKNLVNNTSFRKGFDGWLTTGSNANCIYETYAALSPSGNYDAAKLTAINDGVNHRVAQYITTLENSQVYTVTAYIKAASSDKAYVFLWDGTSNKLRANIDLGNETATISYSFGTSATITAVGNGWYKFVGVSIAVDTSTGNPAVLVGISKHDSATTYSFDPRTSNPESIFVWGLQLEKANTPTEFIPSTDTYTNRQSNATFVDGNGIIRTSYANLLKYSEQLDHSTWTKGSATFTADNVIAPDGTTTADTWGADSTRYGFYNSTAGSWATNHNQLLYPFTITSEWVRHSITVTTASGQTGMRVYPLRTNNNIDYIYQSVSVTENTTYVFSAWYKKVGTKVYVWGCQLVKGTEAGDYYKTTDTISGPPRYSHDPETLTPTGLYLEPAATNLVTYSEDYSVPVWADYELNVIRIANATTAPDGTQTATKWIANTNNHRHRIQFSIGSTLTEYTASIFAKADEVSLVTIRLGRNITGTESARFDLSTGTIVANGSLITSSSITPYGNGWYRLTLTTTPAIVGAQYFAITENTSDITLSAGDGSSGFFVWGAQVETGPVATSYIPTSGAQVTRSADIFTSTATEVLDRANGTKPAFYTKNGLTAFVDAVVTQDAVARRFFELGGPASTQFALVTYSAGTRLGLYFPALDGIGKSASNGASTAGTSTDGNKIAFRFEENNLNISNNGTLGTTITSINKRSPSILFIGKWYLTGATNIDDRHLQGTIKRLTFWTTPLPDNKLDKLTS